MDGYKPVNSSQCKWTKLEINNSSAVVEKKSNSNDITISLKGGMKKKATWSINNVFQNSTGVTTSSNLVGKSFSASFMTSISTRYLYVGIAVRGRLHYKDFADLKGVKFVNYDDDRVIFYNNDYTGKDFSAYVSYTNLVD